MEFVCTHSTLMSSSTCGCHSGRIQKTAPNTHIVIPLGDWERMSDGEPVSVNFKVRRATVSGALPVLMRRNISRTRLGIRAASAQLRIQAHPTRRAANATIEMNQLPRYYLWILELKPCVGQEAEYEETSPSGWLVADTRHVAFTCMYELSVGSRAE